MYRESTDSQQDSSVKTASQMADLSQSQSSLPPRTTTTTTAAAAAPATRPSVPSLSFGSMSKLRTRLSFKHTRAALAEKEILKRENRAVRPLTERNMDTFVINQSLNDARVRRADDLHVSQWLQQLP